jgi:hypothetical protein
VVAAGAAVTAGATVAAAGTACVEGAAPGAGAGARWQAASNTAQPIISAARVMTRSCITSYSMSE